MAPSSADNVSSWSIEDVTEWLAAIGLAHKEDLVKAASLNGSALAKASLEDLQKAGFTSLQSKKILRERPNGETTADTIQSSDGLRAENQALRQELAELRSMIVDLQKAGGGTAANPGGAGVVASRPITRIPFCGGAVIEGNLGNILIVKLSSLMLALRINDSQYILHGSSRVFTFSRFANSNTDGSHEARRHDSSRTRRDGTYELLH